MKKLLFPLIAILGIGAFVYYHFSAPNVLERRLDSLLDSLSFGVVSLKDLDKESEHFASHFADEVTFSGAGNDIISGTVTPADLQELYLNQYRAGAKKAAASKIGDFSIKLTSAKEAEMKATIKIDLVLRDNSTYPQETPALFTWVNRGGRWVISGVKLELPGGGEYEF